MALHQRKDAGKKARFDYNPIYAADVVTDEETGVGVISNWMAFDPKYGPESERQIEWHKEHGTPGAEKWEVGKAVVIPGAGLFGDIL